MCTSELGENPAACVKGTATGTFSPCVPLFSTSDSDGELSSIEGGGLVGWGGVGVGGISSLSLVLGQCPNLIHGSFRESHAGQTRPPSARRDGEK